jgi:hypothetical protein
VASSHGPVMKFKAPELESLDGSLSSSKGSMSTARQRRRRSTRKAGAKNLEHSSQENLIELATVTSLKSSESSVPRSQPSRRVGVERGHGLITNDRLQGVCTYMWRY